MSSFAHLSLRRAAVVGAVIALSGCVVAPPSGPRVVAMPGNGKTYDQFTADDFTCRQAAIAQVGPGPSAQQSTNAAVGSAAIGAGVGALAGAALGSASGHVGGGAAVGGAMGLLAGSAIGGSNAQMSAGEMQRSYDIVYSQCMYSKGNQVPGAAMAPGYGVAQPGYGVVVEPGYAPYPYGYGYARPYYYHPWRYYP